MTKLPTLEVDTDIISVNGARMLYNVLDELETTKRLKEYHQLIRELAKNMKSFNFIPIDKSFELAKQYFEIVLIKTREAKKPLTEYNDAERNAKTKFEKLSARMADIYGAK